MNFTPKSVFTGKNADGSKFTAQEWDFDTWVGFEIANQFVVLVFLMLISAIASPLLLIFAVLTFTGRQKMFYLIGAIIGSYFLFDCKHGWIGLSVLNLFISKESTLNVIVSLNISSVFIHVIFLLFSKKIYGFIIDKFSTIDGRWFAFLIMIFFGFVFIFSVSMNKLETHIGWVSNNLNTAEEQVEQDKQNYYKNELNGFKSKKEMDDYWKKTIPDYQPNN